MSLENIVIAVSLLLGIVLLILIIYLISRVNDLEAKAFSGQGMVNQQKKKPRMMCKRCLEVSAAASFGMNGYRWRMVAMINTASKETVTAF